MYWGLDYPPLTAYHSMLSGYAFELIEPEAVALTTSRGWESPLSKAFMRSTVLLVDLLVYFPPLWLCVLWLYGSEERMDRFRIYFVCLLQPALILVDHGHFQYNCVSLGLALWAIWFLLKDRQLLASCFFCLSLNYKQMSLYFAPCFFAYLLGTNLKLSQFSRSVWKISKIGLVVIFTFVLCWLPFLLSPSHGQQVLHRLFPLARGLFEDKVANIWCALSPVIKFKTLLTIPQTALISLCMTLLAILPFNVDLFWRPSKERFLYALVNTSLCFFLFSFQVHEKSILLPLLPVTILLPRHRDVFGSLILVATMSMLPLLRKDGLVVPCVALCVAFAVLLSQLPDPVDPKPTHLLIPVLSMASVMTGVSLQCLELWFVPPPHLPDLYPLLYSVYGFVCFLLALLYGTWAQYTSRAPLTKSKQM